MKIDINQRWFEFYMETPKSEGEWFLGMSMFRKKWEWGITRDHDIKPNGEYLHSNYFFFVSKLSGVWMGHTFEFPTNKRWHLVKQSL